MAQVNSGNYPIPNDTGANVLSDINENLAALNSNNAGTTAPSNTLAHQFFVDESTSPDTLRIRNASNNGYIDLGKLETDLGHMPKTGGTFTGNLSLPSGTKGSPSIQFNDADTGLFLSSANNIGITTGGTERVNVNSNGLTINEGKELRLKDPQDNNYIAIKSPALSSDITFTLPDSDGKSGDKLESDGNGNLSWQPVAGVPTGSVHLMATTTVPSGYLECNGASLSRTGTYANLFSIIGTTWGAVDSNHFNIPDLRGMFVRGWANTKTGTNDDGRTFAQAQSSRNKSHSHTGSASSTVTDPGHRHPVKGHGGDDDGGDQLTGSNNNATRENAVTDATTGITVATNVTIAADGEDDARPDNIAMMYVIKV